MVKENLRAVLGSMVERYGFETVSRILHELEAGVAGPNARGEREAQRRIRRKRAKQTKRRRSAVDYVQAMEIPVERAAVVRRAAKEFERRVFLPTLGDVRSFCEVFGIEEPRSTSRASGIPRIFKFLVTMEGAGVERMLDDRVFSGLTSLGPIADAIRGKAKEYREAAMGRT